MVIDLSYSLVVSHIRQSYDFWL